MNHWRCITHRNAPKLSSSQKKPTYRLSKGSRQKISNIIVKDSNLSETTFLSTNSSPGRLKKLSIVNFYKKNQKIAIKS